MSNGDVKEAKRMKKVFEMVASKYAANKKQIDALGLFSPFKKAKVVGKGLKVAKELVTNPKVRKETGKKIGEIFKGIKKRQTQEELLEEAGKMVVVGSVGSGFIGKETTINKSKNKTKPKKKKKFKSQY